MANQKIYKNSLGCFFLCILLIITFSCSSKAKYAGVYQTGEADKEMRSEIELTKEGEGYWRVGDNEEPFSWYPKGDEIRLNTRKGGVIVAKIQDDTLEITLSGGKKLTFKKIK